MRAWLDSSAIFPAAESTDGDIRAHFTETRERVAHEEKASGTSKTTS